jgi:hypothetical protein
MTTEDMVDAALVGLDEGELVTIPGLHDGDEWSAGVGVQQQFSRRNSAVSGAILRREGGHGRPGRGLRTRVGTVTVPTCLYFRAERTPAICFFRKALPRLLLSVHCRTQHCTCGRGPSGTPSNYFPFAWPRAALGWTNPPLGPNAAFEVQVC